MASGDAAVMRGDHLRFRHKKSPREKLGRWSHAALEAQFTTLAKMATQPGPS